MFRCLHCMFVCIALHSLQWVGCMLLVAASFQLLQGCCFSRQCLPYSEVSDWGNNCVWAAASCWQRPVVAEVFLPFCTVRAPVWGEGCSSSAVLSAHSKPAALPSLQCHSAGAEWSQASCLSNSSVVFIFKTPQVGLNRKTLSISFKEHCLWHFLQWSVYRDSFYSSWAAATLYFLIICSCWLKWYQPFKP